HAADARHGEIFCSSAGFRRSPGIGAVPLSAGLSSIVTQRSFRTTPRNGPSAIQLGAPGRIAGV
ncbi:MAG: hypothetical protein ABI076_01100, partial [Acidobacteriaceae bacterium]